MITCKWIGRLLLGNHNLILVEKLADMRAYSARMIIYLWCPSMSGTSLSSKIGRFNIGQKIGSGLGARSIVISAIVAVTSFFYIYSVGSYLEIHIFSLFKRVSYDFDFTIYVINSDVDNAIMLVLSVFLLSFFLVTKRRPYWLSAISLLYISTSIFVLFFGENLWLQYLALLSLPLMVTSILLCDFRTVKLRQDRTGRLALTFNYFLFICILVGTTGLIIISTRILYGGADFVPVRNYMYELYLLLSSLSSLLVFIITLCFPIRILFDWFNRLTTHYLGWSVQTERKGRNGLGPTIPVIQLDKGVITLCVGLCISLSILVFIIPHWADVGVDNPDVPRIIGSDTANYAYTIRTLLENNSTLDLVKQSFQISFGTDPKSPPGDRPLTLLFLVGLAYLLPLQLENVIENAALFLAPALIISIFFLTRELTSNDVVSLLAAFLSSLSFSIMAGIYAGYYANWLGLVWGYLSLVFLVKSLRTPRKRNIAVFHILTFLTLLSHIYTWFELILVEASFLLVLCKLTYYCRKKILYLGVHLSMTPILYLVMLAVGDLYPSQVTEDFFGIGMGLGLTQFASRGETLTQAIHIENGGIFANFVILGLAAYWVFRANMHELSSIFLIIFLSIGIIPIFFGNHVIEGRVLYNFPFQVPAAIGLFYIQRNRINGKILLVTICIWLFAISIRSAENFVFVSPYTAFNG